MWGRIKRVKNLPDHFVIVAEKHEGQPINTGCFWKRWELYFNTKDKKYYLFYAWNGLGYPIPDGKLIYKGPFKKKWCTFFDEINEEYVPEEYRSFIKKEEWEKWEVEEWEEEGEEEEE